MEQIKVNNRIIKLVRIIEFEMNVFSVFKNNTLFKIKTCQDAF